MLQLHISVALVIRNKSSLVVMALGSTRQPQRVRNERKKKKPKRKHSPSVKLADRVLNFFAKNLIGDCVMYRIDTFAVSRSPLLYTYKITYYTYTLLIGLSQIICRLHAS